MTEDAVVRHEASTPVGSTVTEALGEGESASAEGGEVGLAVSVSSKDSAPAGEGRKGSDLSQGRRRWGASVHFDEVKAVERGKGGGKEG